MTALTPEIEHAIAATQAGLEPRVLRAIAEAKKFQGLDGSVTQKAKSLIKFGHSAEIDNTGFKVVWEGTAINDEGPLFGDPSLGNVITHVVSADAGDTEVLRVEGHTKSGDDLTFGTQLVTLNGQTPVALSTPLHVAVKAWNTSATEFTGPIYLYDPTDGETNGVPDDPSDVGLYLAGTSEAIHGQISHNAFTAVSSVDCWVVTQMIVDVNRSGSGNYDIEWQRRSTTGVWLPMEVELNINTGGTSAFVVDLNPCIIVPQNHYVRAVGQSSVSQDGEVSVSIGGYLALLL